MVSHSPKESGLFSFWLPNSQRVDLAQLNAITRGVKFCLESGLEIPQLAILAKLSAVVANAADMAEAELTNLKYARTQIKAVTKTLKYLPGLQQLNQQMSLREQYFWFLAVKDVFPILMARAIALEIPRRIIDPLIERYLDPTDPVAHPQCLVTGNDLMRELNLKPSRAIGELLTEIQVAQIESKITTFQQAIDFANFRLQSSKYSPT
jgi:tRNA nucleotidyltransferase (CCA-adding enzyme)